MLIEPEELLAGFDAIVFDCRFSLADPQEGRRLYAQGHIPGAHYLDRDGTAATRPEDRFAPAWTETRAMARLCW